MDIFFLKNAVLLGLYTNIYFLLMILFCGYIYIYSYRFTVKKHIRPQCKNRHGNRHRPKNGTGRRDADAGGSAETNALRDGPPHHVFTKTTDQHTRPPVCGFRVYIFRFNQTIFTIEIITIARIQRYKINKNE